MELDVTHRASLKLRALVMDRSIGRARRVDTAGASVRRHPWCVALQTEDVDLVDLQQTWINRSMGLVTSLAALSLDRHMFEDERSLKATMALEADRILSRFGAQRTIQWRAVGVVAIGAADQSFIDAMTEGLIEVRRGFGVALIAERRLLGDQ